MSRLKNWNVNFLISGKTASHEGERVPGTAVRGCLQTTPLVARPRGRSSSTDGGFYTAADGDITHPEGHSCLTHKWPDYCHYVQNMSVKVVRSSRIHALNIHTGTYTASSWDGYSTEILSNCFHLVHET